MIERAPLPQTDAVGLGSFKRPPLHFAAVVGENATILAPTNAAVDAFLRDMGMTMAELTASRPGLVKAILTTSLIRPRLWEDYSQNAKPVGYGCGTVCYPCICMDSAGNADFVADAGRQVGRDADETKNAVRN
jgi:hypothetical protein